jgi:hypothetical protein
MVSCPYGLAEQRSPKTTHCGASAGCPPVMSSPLKVSSSRWVFELLGKRGGYAKTRCRRIWRGVTRNDCESSYACRNCTILFGKCKMKATGAGAPIAQSERLIFGITRSLGLYLRRSRTIPDRGCLHRFFASLERRLLTVKPSCLVTIAPYHPEGQNCTARTSGRRAYGENSEWACTPKTVIPPRSPSMPGGRALCAGSIRKVPTHYGQYTPRWRRYLGNSAESATRLAASSYVQCLPVSEESGLTRFTLPYFAYAPFTAGRSSAPLKYTVELVDYPSGNSRHGPLAQLVERFHGMEEVRSSILLQSTTNRRRTHESPWSLRALRAHV